MEYRQLGAAGVRVSRICLGTAFRGQKDDAICEQVIHRALDLGCNFLDCANFYGLGRSETIVGRALKGIRDDVVLTTKVWSRIGDGPNDAGLSRFHIVREVERSLKRLQTDHIDIYLLHNFDSDTQSEEILRAMDDVVRQGKVTYVGSCNHVAWQLVEHLGICNREGLSPLICTQNPYSLLNRYEVEGNLLDVCRKYGLGIMTYSPLAVGLLSGRFRRGQDPPDGTPWAQRPDAYEKALSDQTETVIQNLVDIGKRIGKSPAQVAIAWILDHDEITAPMIGPDIPEHVEETFGALGWNLDEPDRTILDEVSAIDPRAPLA